MLDNKSFIMMKRFISLVCLALIMAGTAFAQKENWREKARADKVAFLSTELELSEAEAQAFWPVYNEVEATRREAFKLSSEACKALKKALESGEGDINALLDDYLKKRDEARDTDKAAVARYKKVLSAEKVAKYVLAEEKFRHRQIGKVRDDNKQGGHYGKGQHPNQNRQPARGFKKNQ